MRMDLTDQVALVTGSAHRVGKAIALELARQGVNIMVHFSSTDTDIVRNTAREIKSLGVDAFDVQADLSQPDEIDKIMDAVSENFGRLNILVNSASTFEKGPLLDVTLESWDLAINVNLRAPFLLTQAAARLMLENNTPGGAIVNILDHGADRAWPERPHHGISKAALWMLTQVSAVSLGPEIRVNAVLPGPVIKTESGSQEAWNQKGEALPLKTTGNGDDVARAVVYLASESFVTGTRIHVNGGEHL